MTSIKTHILGFPRIGENREMKHAVESYWSGKSTQKELLEVGKKIRAKNWANQKTAGLDMVSVGEFAWYDHVLNLSAMLGAIPKRFNHDFNKDVDLDTIFRVARGRAPTGEPGHASEMTKWFDTNYHYIVPELSKEQDFRLSYDAMFDEIDEANSLGHKVKPVIVGPVTYLYLSKCVGEDFDKISLLEKILPVYNEILEKFAKQGVEFVQIDEAIMSFELSQEWQDALTQAYKNLSKNKVKLIVANYFGRLEENLEVLKSLPVEGIHIDAVFGEKEVSKVLSSVDFNVVSIGVVNGRNIWRNDLTKTLAELERYVSASSAKEIWVASSCSLVHSPVDLDCEDIIDSEIKSWLAFAKQKCQEVAVLGQALQGNKDSSIFANSDSIKESRKNSAKVNNKEVLNRAGAISEDMFTRKMPYKDRIVLQRTSLGLPALPTTNIGSFPQTDEIRTVRREFKAGKIDETAYKTAMKKEIDLVVKKQEEIGLDVLVHGEPERNDMVEYFGELMQGYAFTKNGWVQSYGSRCVKPPIIYGDVSRPNPMTIEWSSYAQSLSKKVVKGMLTGPITMLFWSFVRDDITDKEVCYQLGLALRDEVVDLQNAGVNVIQIDEPAFREGLPLRRKEWNSYLDWAVRSFGLSASGIKNETQIHTHMCYSEFNDIIDSIAALDADVITIETSRSNMELLEAFEKFKYPNDIGPGVYDIHTPNVPTVEYMVELMKKAIERIPVEQLWINPDCGLKTRKWPETQEALKNMVKAAYILREEIKS
jgi:5-methyltetrahydropteroyltriglutamate--homocysteine methyltransferase